jgi:RHS repeat-associated protein
MEKEVAMSSNASVTLSASIERCQLTPFSTLFGCLIQAMCIVGFGCLSLHAQSYLTSTGSPSFAASYPVELGSVDAASGNLHLEIPLGSFPQRKNGALAPRLVYDSHIWGLPTDGASQVWTLTGTLYGLAFGTWGFYEGGNEGVYQLATAGSNTCNEDMMLWDESGTQHFFNIPGTLNGSTCSGGTGYATDSSGYQIRQTAWNDQGLNATLSVFAPDGTEVYGSDLYNNGIASKDANGNYLSLTTANTVPPGVWNPVSDTLGRKVAAPQFDSNPMTIQVPNSQGGLSNYIVTTTSIPVKTNFQESGITECNNNCTATVIKSLVLPDNSSYTFLYDCDSTSGNPVCNASGSQSGYYGTLTQMTMPTGEQINYNYSMFGGVSWGSNHNQFPSWWLTSKSSNQGTWTYTPTATAGAGTGNNCLPSFLVGCLQTVVQRPDGSKEATTFIVDPVGGSYPQSVTSYDTDGVTVLSTVNNSWDFSNRCTLNLCGTNGYQYVRKLSASTTVPVPGGSLTKQTKYSYSASAPQFPNVTAIKEWKYQWGTSPTFATVPDRATYMTYATIGANNNVNRPLTVTVCNNVGSSDTNCSAGGGGTTVARTTITYDSYSGGNCSTGMTSVSGVVNHDDTNFGCSYTTRGNPTQINTWVSGTTYLTSTLSYDTTGQTVKVVDAAGNSTTYSFADSFFSDNGGDPYNSIGSGPPAFTPTKPTNAYVTSASNAIGTITAGYYYGSGKMALSTDYDNVTTYTHFMDSFDRETETDSIVGWSLNVYTSLTQVDSYLPIGYTGTAASSCSLCVHSQSLFDILGRVTVDNVVNNPAGQVSATYAYDQLNRLVSSSHPNFGSSDPNDVLETQYYDGLSRALAAKHPDGQLVRTAFGAYVGDVGGVTTQQSSTTTYGYGYPVASIDESGKQRQEWIDGFGHVIEVDEPSASTSTPGSGSLTVTLSPSQLSKTWDPCKPRGSCPMTKYNSGTLTVAVNGFEGSAQWAGADGGGSTTTSVAASLAGAFGGPTSPVSAMASGATVSFTAKTGGASTDYTFSSSSTYDNTDTCPVQVCFTGPAFATSPASGALTGGAGGIDSSPLVTTYTYDALGDLTGVVQGSQTRSWQYDGLSRLTQETTPEAGTITLSYVNSSGSPCSGNPSSPCSRAAPEPNQSGTQTVTTTYSYDSANRMYQKTHSDSTGTVSYTFQTTAYGKGLPATMTDPSGSETYTYDSMKRITKIVKKIGTVSYTTQYSYNTAGQVTQITYPSGRIVYYNYDAVGHLCQVASASSTSCGAATPYLTLPSAQYDAAGRPLSATYGNGVVMTTAYDPNSFSVTNLSYVKGSTTLFGLKYYYQKDTTNCPTGNTLGNNGQIQCINDTVQASRNVAYTYDSLGRLLTAVTAGGSSAYPQWGLSETYDRYGNRSAQTVTVGSGFSVSYTINAVNNQISTFSYDAAGNVTSLPSSSGTFSYDSEECNTAFAGNGSNATYTCDGNELRVQKVVTGTNAVNTLYVRSGGQLLAEYDNGAAVTSPTREFLYGNNLLATVTGSTTGSGGTIIYQQRDHLSPRMYTDANGNCVGDQGTYPFGEPWYKNNDPNCNTTASSSWIYTSYERDAESGDDYALARSYASTQGRFTTPDPLEGVVGDPQSWNRYAYVENDPVNLSDPSGEGFWADLGLAIASIFVDAFCQACIPVMTAIDEGAAAAQTAAEVVQDIVRIAIISCTVVGTGEPCGVSGPGAAGSGGNNGTVDTNSGGNSDAGSSNPEGGPGAGTTDPEQTGASGQGVGAPGSWGAGGDGVAQQLKWKSVTAAGTPFPWTVRWSLTHNSPRGGWIVQHITMNVPRVRLPFGTLGPATYSYWEAWRVNPDSHLTAQYNDNFGGEGGTTIDARARFYEGLKLPQVFQAGGVGPAGRLMSAWDNPTNNAAILPALSAAKGTALNHRWYVVP